MEAAAYAITRLPMTFGAQLRVLQEVRDRSPGFRPRTLLDYGAGPAPALWAARRVFGEHFGGREAGGAGRGDGGGWGGSSRGGASVTLVDASPSMMAFARRLARVVYDKRSDDDEDGAAGGAGGGSGGDGGMGFMPKPFGRPAPEPDPWGDSGPVRTVASLRSLGGTRNAFDLVVAGYALGELAAVGTDG